MVSTLTGTSEIEERIEKIKNIRMTKKLKKYGMTESEINHILEKYKGDLKKVDQIINAYEEEHKKKTNEVSDKKNALLQLLVSKQIED